MHHFTIADLAHAYRSEFGAQPLCSEWTAAAWDCLTTKEQAEFADWDSFHAAISTHIAKTETVTRILT